MRAIAPPAKGSPTVTTTMRVPSALISGLHRYFQHGEDLGRHCFDPGRTPEHARGDVVEGDGEDEEDAGDDRRHEEGKGDLAEGVQAVGAERESRLLIDALDADEAACTTSTTKGSASMMWPRRRSR